MLTYKSYGNSEKPVLCLLPGAGLGAWAYNQVIPLITKNFYVIIPDVLSNFKTIDNAIYQLHELISIKFNRKIKILAGLSLGSQIALALVAKYPAICDDLLLESCAVFPQSISKLIKPFTKLSYPLTRFNWFNKLQAMTLHLPPKMDRFYNQEVKAMSEQTLVNMLSANTAFNIQNLIPINFKGKIIIAYGTKEEKLIIKSSNFLSKEFINSRIIPLKNYYHGELTLSHPGRFCQIINGFQN